MPTLQKKIVKGNTYWYITTSKRINGKPTPIILKYLGTIENILKQSKLTEDGSLKYKSYSHGAVYALWKIAEKYNILNIMRKYFKSNSKSGIDISTSLLLGAIHRACDGGGSKRSFSEFARETTLPEIADFKADKITSQHFWDQMDKVTVIFDKGGCSKGNLRDIQDEGFHYICAFSLTHKKDLVEIPLSDYETKKVNDKDILLLRKEENIWDKKRTVLLYYSSKLHQGQIRGLNKSIKDKKEKLMSLQETLKNPRTGIKTRAQLEKKLSDIIKGEHGTELFKIKIRRKKPLSFDFSFDTSRYDYITGEIFGKKAIITDRSDWSTEDILSSYFSQSDIEKVFRHVKNPDHNTIRPQFHWTDQKIHVHVFICLLGFMLTCLLQKELQDQGFIAEKEKIIDTLMKVRQYNAFRLNNSKKSKVVDTKLEEMDEYKTQCYNALLKAVEK